MPQPYAPGMPFPGGAWGHGHHPIVLKAFYGVFADVLHTVRTHQHHHGWGHRHHVTNATFGTDPTPGFPKELIIVGYVHGSLQVVQEREGSHLVVPRDMEIMYALYGKVAEVTAYVGRGCTVSNGTLGGDPLPGKPKRAVALLGVPGVPGIARVVEANEGGQLNW